MTPVNTKITQPHEGQRLYFPFLDTPVLWDVRWLLYLFPIWWLLGVEQFIWTIGFTWAAIKLVIRKRGRLQVLLPLRLLALFIGIYLISGLSVAEPLRIISFIRNLAAYLATFAVGLLVTNSVKSWLDVKRLLNALFFAMSVSAFLGLVGLLGIWQPEIVSFAGQILPPWIGQTDYGSRIAYRVIGGTGWFMGLGQYFRLSGLFLYATLYASALVYVIPFLLFRLRVEATWRRVIIFILLTIVVVNLIFTTARTAIVSLLAGSIYYAVFASRQRRLYRGIFTSVAVFLIGLMSLSVLVEDWTGSIKLTEGLANTVNTFLYARGSGSFSDRFQVYEATIRGVGERPFFGWGTERDIEGLELPAGSHSEYLAILYRQGGIGFLIYMSMLFALWRYTRPVAHAQSQAGLMLRHGRWFFVTVLINSIATVPLLDGTVVMILWLSFSLLLVTRKIATDHDPATA
jgi:hypothetical protein